MEEAKTKALGNLVALDYEVNNAMRKRIRQVKTCRELGATWDDIALALQLPSRQHAHRKYSESITE